MEKSEALVREPVQDAQIVESNEVNKEEQPVTDSKGAEPSPSELVALGRPPYVTDLLQARMAYETFDVKEQLSEIDAYIRESTDDSRASYEAALNGLKQHIKETDDIYTTLAQLTKYVRIQQKINGIIKEKEEFERKSPGEMSGEELKRFLTENGTKRYSG